jgi:hypothetical protein
MKRDLDLLRWILNEVESCSGGYPVVLTKGVYGGKHSSLDIGDRNFAEVCEHILLLGDARVIASYLLQKIQTKREKYSVKKKQSSKRRKGYYLKKVSE